MLQCTPVEIEPGPVKTSDSKSNTILSGLTDHVLLRRSKRLASFDFSILNLLI